MAIANSPTTAVKWSAAVPLVLSLTMSCSEPRHVQEEVPSSACAQCAALVMPQFAEMVAGAHTSVREIAEFVDLEDDLAVAIAALPEDEYYEYQESDFDTTSSMLARRVQAAVGDHANVESWVAVELDGACEVRVPALDMTLIVGERPRCLIVDFVHRGTSLLQSR